MKIELIRGNPENRLKFDRLIQFYIYDFTDFLEWDLNEEGLFEEKILDDYFVDETRTAWLIMVEEKLAGFVLVNAETVLEQNAGGHNVKEFFVLRRWRRKGVGGQAAMKIFSMFQGKWEVKVMRKNVNAEKFWGETISEYTRGEFRKEMRDDRLWRGAIFSFESV